MLNPRGSRLRGSTVLLTYLLFAFLPAGALVALSISGLEREETQLLEAQREHARISLSALSHALTDRIRQRLRFESDRPYYEYEEFYRSGAQGLEHFRYLENPRALRCDADTRGYFNIRVNEQGGFQDFGILPRADAQANTIERTWSQEIVDFVGRPFTVALPAQRPTCRFLPLEVVESNEYRARLDDILSSACAGDRDAAQALEEQRARWRAQAQASQGVPVCYETFSTAIEHDDCGSSLLAIRRVTVPRLSSPENVAAGLGTGASTLPTTPWTHLVQGFVLELDRLIEGQIESVRSTVQPHGIHIHSAMGHEIEGNEDNLFVSLHEALGHPLIPGSPVPGLVATLDRSIPLAKIAEERRELHWLLGGLAFALLLASFLFLRSLRHERELVGRQHAFVSAVTHEMRTPVASIKLYTDLLDQGWFRDVDTREDYFATLRRETTRLESLVDDVLHIAAFDRKESTARPSLTLHDLRETVQATARDFAKTKAGARARLELHLEDSPVLVPHDPESIQRVLRNLLDNAVKYSPGQENPPVTLSCHRAGERATLSVRDEGLGIAAFEQRRIFDDFYRIGSEDRRRTSGTGLGLGIVRRHVEAHGGTIHCESAPGEGSTFTIELPMSPSHRSNLTTT